MKEKEELGLFNIEKAFNRTINETKAKLFDGSVRSGNKIEYDGTIIIYGDVNSGAEIIASEYVVIVGTLRGLAHAGAKGNKKAMVIASKIESSQIRIADIVKEMGNQEEQTIKTKAYVRGKEIVLE